MNYTVLIGDSANRTEAIENLGELVNCFLDEFEDVQFIGGVNVVPAAHLASKFNPFWSAFQALSYGGER